MLLKNEDHIISKEEEYKVFEKEVEIPASLNLSLCYLKVKDYQMAIKYSSDVLKKEPDNDKALYRKGLAHLGFGDIPKAKQELTRAHEITEGKDQNVVKALQ